MGCMRGQHEGDRKEKNLEGADREEKDLEEVNREEKEPEGADRKGPKRAGAIVGTILFALLGAVSLLALFSARWAFGTWADLKMEEIIFELQAPLEGTGNGMIGEYLLSAVLPAALILAAVLIALSAVRRRAPRALKVCYGIAAAAFALILFFAIFRADAQLEIADWIKNESESSEFIKENYVDPSSVRITFPEKKKNLVMIYLESMEVTSAGRENGGAFDSNFIPELVQLAKDNEDFSGPSDAIGGGISLTGTTWTMGAMFGTTTGLPLKVEIGNNNMTMQGSFFPEITALGDILRDAGYRERLFIGSDATFGGRRLYYTEHGNFEIEDYLYAQDTGRIPMGYYVFWGFEDRKLFSFAKESLLDLASSGEPFNFTMLTADTHLPGGYLCDLCRDDFSLRYGNVMACSSRQTAEFVDWIKEQDFYRDTAVVIVGDHPTMDAEYRNLVPKKYQRKVYTCFINGFAENESPDEERLYSTFDFFPTTLAAMGCGIEGERLGLGTNLYGKEPTLLEKYSLKEVKKELKKKSPFLKKLEKVDLRTYDGIVNAEVRCASYDGKTGELGIEVGNLSGLASPFASAEAVYTGKDGEKLAAERTEAIGADGICRLTLRIPSGEVPGGSLDVWVTDRDGTKSAVLKGEKNFLLKTEEDPWMYAEVLRAVTESGDCSALIAAANDDGSFVSPDLIEALAGLSLQVSASGSYAAAVTPSGIRQESGGETPVRMSGVLPHGEDFLITSGGSAGQPSAGILIDKKSCSSGKNGLHIALTDNESGTILQETRLVPESMRDGGESCNVSLEGKLKLLGRWHIRVSNLSVPAESVACVVSYWYEDHPEEIRTIQLAAGDGEDFTGVLEGRMFTGSAPRVSVHLVRTNGTGEWIHPDESSV